MIELSRGGRWGNIKLKFMTQIFKVLKDFELDGEAVRSGQEVVCRAREAEKLQKEGYLATVDRELDPKVKKDADLIAKSDARAGKRHAEIKDTEAAKDELREEREIEKDAVRAAKVAEAVALRNVLEPDLIAQPIYEAMPDEKLDKEIETMKAAVPPAPEATEPAKEEAPAPAPVKAPKKKTTQK